MELPKELTELPNDVMVSLPSKIASRIGSLEDGSLFFIEAEDDEVLGDGVLRLLC